MKCYRFIWLPLIGIMMGAAAGRGYSQQLPLQVSFDHAVFRYDQETSFIEIYYAINKKSMSYRPAAEGGFETAVHMLVAVHSSDSLVNGRQWQMRSTEPDTAAIDPVQSILDCVKFTLPPGDYVLSLTARDLIDPENGDSVRTEISVPVIPQKQAAMSSLQLARSVRRIEPDQSNPFYKNSLEVMPNPARLYGQDNKFIFYYAELYNLIQGLEQQKYFTRYYISDDDGRIQEDVPAQIRERQASQESSVIYGALKVGELATGSYLFNLEILDAEQIPVLSRKKKFFVFNTERMPEETSGISMNEDQLYYSSEFAEMTLDEAEEEFAKIRYLATNEELRFYEGLSSLEEKQKWLFRFWRLRDTDPQTALNEYRLEYVRRINYATRFFKEMGVEGWKTDRGRVYCIYGEPDFIERFPNEIDRRPYQIWNYYNLQGGVKFVFGDVQENREYQLLHSDVRGEVKNTGWESLLLK